MRNIILILLIVLILRVKSFADTPTSLGLAFSSKFDNSPYKKLKKYWIAVSKMETDNWTSNLFVKHNNLFGFKYNEGLVLQEPIERSEFAHYKSINDSLDDLLKHLKRKNYPTSFPSLKDMIKFMSSYGYFGTETVASYYAKVIGKNKEFSNETKELIQIAKNELGSQLSSVMIEQEIKDVWDFKLNKL